MQSTRTVTSYDNKSLSYMLQNDCLKLFFWAQMLHFTMFLLIWNAVITASSILWRILVYI